MKNVVLMLKRTDVTAINRQSSEIRAVRNLKTGLRQSGQPRTYRLMEGEEQSQST